MRMFGEDGPVITNAIEHMTSSFGILRIPQVNINANFKTSISSELGGPTIKEDPNLSSAVQSDGTYISVQPRTILMQVLEKYSVFEKENFDIEVYFSGSETEARVIGSPKLENWTPLSFKKKMANIVDGILIDPQEDICHDHTLDSTYVEYYFDIFVNNEIDETIREKVKNVINTNSKYVGDDNALGTAGVFEIANIYSQVVPDESCPVDPCVDKPSE